MQLITLASKFHKNKFNKKLKKIFFSKQVNFLIRLIIASIGGKLKQIFSNF